MNSSLKSLVSVVFLVCALAASYSQTAASNKRLNYPIQWASETGRFLGSPTVKMLYESGCLNDLSNGTYSLKAKVINKLVSGNQVTYVVESFINGESYMTVTAKYTFDDDAETATLTYIKVVNNKKGGEIEYSYDGTSHSAGQLLGALCETGKVYLDFDKINAMFTK